MVNILNELNMKNKNLNPWDYIRVVNLRGEKEYQPTSDEKVIIAHRGNPILGNKHPMKVQTMKERDRVIAAYKEDLENDLAHNGVMYQALQSIAKDIVDRKQKIALSCYCSPLKCHAEHLIPVVIDMAHSLLSEKNIHYTTIKP